MNLRSGIVALLLVILGPIAGPISAHAGQGNTSNFVNCVSGSAFGCNRNLLTDAERAQVQQADHQS